MHVDLVAINTVHEKPTLIIPIDQQQQLCKAFGIQQMANQETIDIGRWGGEGVEAWNWPPPSTDSCITEINITYGDIVNSLEFKSYDRTTNKTVPSPIYGGKGPKPGKVSVDGSTEYLNMISGTVKKNDSGDLVVESLTFGTNTDPSGTTFGHGTGTPFSVPLSNGEIVGFSGRQTKDPSGYINALGIHVIRHA